MANYVALHDLRLNGAPAPTAGLTVLTTNGGTALGQAFSAIRAAAQNQGPLHTLFILCHGYAGANNRAAMCMDAGGMGLQLGKEDVLHSNVHLWTAIGGSVSNVVVYACAASNTEAGNEGTEADGRYLMGALAIHTNADVFAADRIQWYRRSNGFFRFGAWEGELLHFPPSGAPPTRVSAPPVDLFR